MTPEQLALLLATARALEAQIADRMSDLFGQPEKYKLIANDYFAIHQALKPFDVPKGVLTEGER